MLGGGRQTEAGFRCQRRDVFQVQRFGFGDKVTIYLLRSGLGRLYFRKTLTLVASGRQGQGWLMHTNVMVGRIKPSPEILPSGDAILHTKLFVDIAPKMPTASRMPLGSCPPAPEQSKFLIINLPPLQSRYTF